MNKILFIPTILILLFSCDGNNSETDWLKNGTLHKSKVKDWKNATDENKLATCADFAAKIKEMENEKYKTINEMKIDAIELKSCIDAAVNGGDYTDHMLVSEISVMCHMTMNY